MAVSAHSAQTLSHKAQARNAKLQPLCSRPQLLYGKLFLGAGSVPWA